MLSLKTNLFGTLSKHEMGHNLGLMHFGEGNDSYGDESGVMGYSYSGHEGPKMCFNPAKSWQLGWYDDQCVEIYPQNQPWTGKLAGVANYNPNAQDESVILKLEDASNDWFIGYNLATGFNSQTQQAQNKVTVVQESPDDNFPSYKISTLVAELDVGDTYTIKNYYGHEDVTVAVKELAAGPQGYAYLMIYMNDECGSCCYDIDCRSGCPFATCQAKTCTYDANTCPNEMEPHNTPTNSPVSLPIVPQPTLSPSGVSSDAPVLPIVALDYENFQSWSSSTSLWKLGSNKDARIENKYRDALDGTIDTTSGIKLRKNKGFASSTYTKNIDVSRYDALTIEFYFAARNFEDGAGFYLEADIGNSGDFEVVHFFQAGRDIFNEEGVWKRKVVDIGVLNANNIVLRFRCAAINKGEVRLDHIKLTSRSDGQLSPTAVPSRAPSTPPTSDVEIDYETFESFSETTSLWNLGSDKNSEIKAKYLDAIDPSFKTSALKLKKNDVLKSRAFTDSIDVSEFPILEVDFYYTVKRFLDGNGFNLEARRADVSQTFTVVNSYEQGNEFDVDAFDEGYWYHAILELDVSAIDWVVLQFRCLGGNKGEVQIDHIKLTGKSDGNRLEPPFLIV